MNGSRKVGLNLLIMVALLAANPLLAEEPQGKIAVPELSAQADATKLVLEVYGKELNSAKTNAQKQALAAKLIATANENVGDPVGRFVLLKTALDVASQAMDVETAFTTINALDKTFAIDALELKEKMLTKAAGVKATPEQHKSLSDKSATLAEEAVLQGRYDLAKRMIDVALDTGRKANDPALVKKLADRKAAIGTQAKQFADAKQALEVLDKSPTDADANLLVGKYICFVEADYKRGLPYLAKGSDAALKELATVELKGATTAQERCSIGDMWWNTTDKQDVTGKKQAQIRAAYWYKQALPELSRLAKDKAEKRLQAIETSDAKPGVVWVKIINQNSELCLAVSAGSRNRGERVTQWDDVTTPEVPDQYWRFEPAGDGYVKIVNKNSGLCLGVFSDSRDRGAPIVQWDPDNKPDKLWKIEPVKNGYVKVVNKNSGFCLNVSRQSREKGADIIQWDDDGGTNCYWRVQDADKAKGSK